MNEQFSLLFPSPQRLYEISRNFSLPEQPLIYLASTPHHIHFAAQRLKRALQAHGLRPQLTAASVEKDGRPDVHITLRVNPRLLEQPDSVASRWESYRLVIDERGVTLIGADEAGLFYGVCTLNQLIHLSAPQTPGKPFILPGLHLTDWPDYPHRGVMLDVSRDKVPTMETLFDLVDRLASWKVNQLQLYTEHTFAYRGHELVWANASPFTGEEILALDAFCRERYVELVPNQNNPRFVI
jgi:hypothetical protein